MARIVILGGGSGGLVVANKLARGLRGTDHEILLVDRSPYHYFMPSFPWVALGFKEPEQVRRPLKNLEKKGVRVSRARCRRSASPRSGFG